MKKWPEKNRIIWIFFFAVTFKFFGCATVKKSWEKKVPEIVWDIDFQFLDRKEGRGTQFCLKEFRKSRNFPKKLGKDFLKKRDKISKKQLLKAMETAPTPGGVALSRLKVFGDYIYFKKEIFKADLKRIKKFYRYSGFYWAKVFFDFKRDKRLLAGPNSYRKFKRISLKIKVCEGPQVRVRKIYFQWLPEKPANADLLKGLPLEEGGNFSTPRYEDYKLLLLQRLQREGYALAKIEGRVLIDREKLWADVYIRVTTGPICYFGDIRIKNLSPNPSVDKEIIRRLIRYYIEKGDKFTTEVLAQVQAKLFALGLFRVVNFKPALKEAEFVWKVSKITGKTAEKIEIPITLELREEQPQLLRFGLGAVLDGQRQQIEGNVTWSWLNFLGGLRELEFQFRGGWAFLPSFINPFDNGPEITALLDFRQPLFMDRKGEFGARILFRRLEEIGDNDFSTLTPTVWFARPLVSGISLQVSMNLELSFGVENPITLRREDYILNFLEEQLVFDFRDNKISPSRGVYWNILSQQAFLGTFSYLKFYSDFRFYLPLPADIILSGKLVYGVMFSKRNEESKNNPYLLSEVLRQSPISQRFFSGGAASVRGWTTKYLSPLLCRIQREKKDLFFQRESVSIGGSKTEVLRGVAQAFPKSELLSRKESKNIRELVDQVVKSGQSCRQAAFTTVRDRSAELASKGYYLSDKNRGSLFLHPGNSTLQVIPLGGNHLLEFSLELRVPLYFLMDNLRMAIFLDLGTVQLLPQFEDPRELIPSVSSGVGFRYDLSGIGSIRLDLAFRILPDEERYPLQQGWQIHFSFGEAF